jgi:hypothetical protein
LNNNVKKHSKYLHTESSDDFKKFISKFRIISLPFLASTGCYEPDSSLSVPLDMDTDSVFIKFVGPAVTVGMLPDTARFYAVVFCTASACYMPVLAVYAKNGLLIDKKEISRGCGAGVGYTCSEVLRISSLKDISVVYTQELFEVDSFGNMVKGSNKKKTDTYVYSIGNEGNIHVNVSQSN